MTNHIDTHSDIPLIPAFDAHVDIPSIPPDIAHGDTHTDTPEFRHQDVHADIIEFNQTTTHIDTPSITAVFIHEDTPFIAPDSHGDAHGDVTRVLHGDASNFHLDIPNPHTDIPHSDRHGDGLQFSDNGAHGDVHHDSPPDHTDGINHAEFITTLLNNRKDFHEDIPRITFHSDSSFHADRSLENESGEEDK